MIRNKPSSSLQKTYDECYLICSTAVYFEGQGNEAEALRSWRSALDQIYYHNAYRVPANYRPRSETERALQDSLRDMELQCKERVDLLEALKRSRQERNSSDGPTSSSGSNGKIRKIAGKSSAARQSSDSEGGERGYIGGGTIPAVSVPELARPGPPLPQRPAPSKSDSERAVVGRNLSGMSIGGPSTSIPPSYSPSLAPPTKKSSRSPSPEKGRSMLTTLRSFDKSGKRPAARGTSSRLKDGPGASKAASLAWGSLGRPSGDKVGRSLDSELTASSATLDDGIKSSLPEHSTNRPGSSRQVRYDYTTRRLVDDSPPKRPSSMDLTGFSVNSNNIDEFDRDYPYPAGSSQPRYGGDSSTKATTSSNDLIDLSEPRSSTPKGSQSHSPQPSSHMQKKFEPVGYPTYLREYPETSARQHQARDNVVLPIRRRSPAKARAEKEPSSSSSKTSRKPLANSSSPRFQERRKVREDARQPQRMSKKAKDDELSSQSIDDTDSSSEKVAKTKRKTHKTRQKSKEDPILVDPITLSSDSDEADDKVKTAWEEKVAQLMKNLPKGVDEAAAKQIFNEIVVQGDEVHWEDVAGLDIAKTALKETVVYPFLRPDLFMGLREPARGMLLFGPPGTGKTMLARAVATESRSTFFSISASSLTSKYLGESEKLVRALFSLAKALAPSIIFVDEIDSLLSSRSGSGEHEATRRIKTEFLIQWSDLQRAAAGREQSERDRERGDASRVLVLAATNLPWAIDEAARRRFVRRQYIPLPEDVTRAVQLRTLLGHQKHSLSEGDVQKLIALTDGFSGSDITALAKDAAMGPLRSLGEALLHMTMDEIRPIQFQDFEASLINIRPSVSKQGLKEFEDWAKEFGERGG